MNIKSSELACQFQPEGRVMGVRAVQLEEGLNRVKELWLAGVYLTTSQLRPPSTTPYSVALREEL